MAFKFPESRADILTALDEASVDKQLSEPARALMSAAAMKLRECNRLLHRAADQLDTCAAVKIGQMDSESRANEKYQNVKNILQVLSAEFRAAL